VTPDLTVKITSQSMNRKVAGEIASSEWPPNALLVQAGTLRSLPPKRLQIGSDQVELFIGAHDILDEKADWNSATWLFDPTELPRFIATLQRLYQLMPEDFELVAAWALEEPSREQRVTRSELLAIVSSNKLANAVVYRVRAG
jgi:hypothetical protein